MKLDSVDLLGGIFHDGDGTLGGGDNAGSRRETGDVIAMAGPNAEPFGETGEEQRGTANLELCRAVFSPLRALHFAAQSVGQPLHAVADAEDGEAQPEDSAVTNGSAGVVHRTRPARQHKPARRKGPNLFERYGARQDDGIDALLAYAAGDQLCVLRTKIENDNAAGDAHDSSSPGAAPAGAGSCLVSAR